MKYKTKNRITHTKTDSRGRRKGSVSVEASLVFPLFFFCIMLLSRLFLLIITELYVSKTVCGLTASMAPVSYAERAVLKEKVTAPSLLCYPELFIAIGSHSEIENLRISCTDDDNQNVEVSVFYDFPMQMVGFPAFEVHVKQCFLIHPYIGEYDSDKLSEDDEDEKEVVYIVENGQVYHLKRTCSYLFMPVESVSETNVKNRRNASGAKYYLCDKCKNSRNTGTVYITSYGNRYHYNAQCSTLYRDVQEVEIDEVADRRPCSKCGKE